MGVPRIRTYTGVYLGVPYLGKAIIFRDCRGFLWVFGQGGFRGLTDGENCRDHEGERTGKVRTTVSQDRFK